MKAISADPADSVDAGSSESLSSPSSNSIDGSLLALGDLTLDRSIETVSPDLAISEVSTVPVTSTPSRKSVTAKRYPSFRDIFMKPLRRRRSVLSSSPDDRAEDETKKRMKKKKKKKDKMNSSGCAGWLEKKKKRKAGEPSLSSSAESSNGSSEPPPLVTAKELEEDGLQCSRCCRVDGPAGLKGVTYTKRPIGVNKDDETWLCSDCIQSLRTRRGSSQETDEDLAIPFHRVAPLAHLALNVLISDVSFKSFTLYRALAFRA